MDCMESVENESVATTTTLLDDLNIRLDKYLAQLKSAETEGNNSKARRYKRIVKQYQDAITLHKKGKAVPLDELPNPPGFKPLVTTTSEALEGGEFLTPDLLPSSPTDDLSPKPRSRDPSPNPVRQIPRSPLPAPRSTNVNQTSDDSNAINVAVPVFVNDKNIDEIGEEPVGEMDVLQELKLRLEVYNTVLKSAEADGNSSKARRYKRIIKQYTDAISLQKAGKAVPLEELPSPPGFPPLVPVKPEPPSASPSGSFIHEDESTEGLPTNDNVVNEPSTSIDDATVKTPVVTRSDKQTALLKERQKEYKGAALAAKKEGNLEKAKELLKLCKGFDRLIEASESGLPVDLSTLPVSLKDKKQVDDNIQEMADVEDKDSDNSEMYNNLEKELMDQIKMCINTRNHFKMNGDIAHANQFEQYALRFKRDLNYVKILHTRNAPVPKFHYQTKTFSTILSNTDLADTELEMTIMQGINYKVSNPNDVDTYVTYEFPYPSSSPPSGRTSTVKNTNNPLYNHRVVFAINKEVSACQRVFKRHGIKMEVWSKGGFFHRDSSLGTVVVKLMPLAKEIKIHEAFDLMNGRRPAGGKLEVKVRIRDPIAGRKIETVTERWLIIDNN